MTNKKGFTLIELLVVLGLIAILAAILIAVINPVRIFRRARDTQRIGDLRNLSQALSTYIIEKSQGGTIYLSGTSSNDRCVGAPGNDTIYNSADVNGTTTVGGFVDVIGTTSQATNGTGWVPVDLQSIGLIQLAQLPRDPSNTKSPDFYYTYACKVPDYSFELNARLEEGATDNDGGNNPNLYEEGPAKDILPSTTGTNFYQGW